MLFLSYEFITDGENNASITQLVGYMLYHANIFQIWGLNEWRILKVEERNLSFK